MSERMARLLEEFCKARAAIDEFYGRPNAQCDGIERVKVFERLYWATFAVRKEQRRITRAKLKRGKQTTMGKSG